MKLSASVLAGLLAGSSLLSAQTATFTFTDPSFEEGDVASFFIGDTIGGNVEINLGTGDYTATWIASEFLVFTGPQRFELVLGNLDKGTTATLTYEVLDMSTNEEVIYSGNDPVLATWQLGDAIVTAGTLPDFPAAFQSRIISLDPFVPADLAYDNVSSGGILEGDEPVVVDTDGDGIPDDSDPFPVSDLSETVILLGIESGIPNEIAGLPVEESGATLADVIHGLEAGAAEDSKNKGDYVQQLSKAFKDLVKDGWITDRQRGRLMKIIASGR